MLGRRQPTHPAMRRRGAGAALAATAAITALAACPAPGLATDNITVGAAGGTIVVNGTTISTSNLTLAQLAKLQGVTPATVDLELDGLAAGSPVASAVEALVRTLSDETPLGTALEDISNVSGGAISPQTALRQLVEDEGQPGSAGAGGSSGNSGGSGTPGANGAPAAPAPAPVLAPAPSKTAFTLRASSASLKGRPGSRVRVSYKVSSAAKLSYSGSKLAKGSRKVPAGTGVLMVKLPRKHGNYRLTLKALSAVGSQSAQASVVLHDAAAKAAKKPHHK
jgi:hypothetical protein